MKFNMGCGHNRMDGWINVDAMGTCNPDQIWDLEEMPWPWQDNCAEEVRFIHSLEHMGGDPKVFLSMMKELYRISAPGCVIEIRAPHPRHDNFINDPTHVRAITAPMMELFDKEMNDQWQASGAANSPLAHYTGVDFKIVNYLQVTSRIYREQLQSGAISPETVAHYALERLNVIEEIRLRLVVRKDS